MKTKVAEARRSQLLGTFGIGSMFPAPEQSLMICGLDHWRTHPSLEISEQRLAQSLGVTKLMTPPAGWSAGDVPVVRFPRWYFCPECRRLGPWNTFDTVKNPRCNKCERDAVPTRFVIACPNGHIDDFPYSRWVHRGPVTEEHRRSHKLSLETRGETSSLADVEIRCTCGTHRTMEGSFAPKSLLGIQGCTGRRPWLPGAPAEQCQHTTRVMQRGSSSTWYADVRSAISIPPWSDIHNKVKTSWSMLKGLPPDLLKQVFAAGGWIPEGSPWTVTDLVQAVTDLREAIDLTDEDLRRQEYAALCAGNAETKPTDQFVCSFVSLNGTMIQPFITDARDVSRLREVTALVGFTRLLPPGSPGATTAKVSVDPTDWLPAVEVFGEGLFLRFDPKALEAWEQTDFAKTRTKIIAGRAEGGHPVTPRRLLVHTFAHALLNELSMDAGYPVASLRERVYAGKDQCGVLIYTATADSAGSLGGLSAQSEPARLEAVVTSTMRRALWCTLDPVCIESQGSGIDNLNLAACHACLLVPETSCEQRNCYLDRALLIGTPDAPTAGYFSELVSG